MNCSNVNVYSASVRGHRTRLIVWETSTELTAVPAHRSPLRSAVTSPKLIHRIFHLVNGGDHLARDIYKGNFTLRLYGLEIIILPNHLLKKGNYTAQFLEFWKRSQRFFIYSKRCSSLAKEFPVTIVAVSFLENFPRCNSADGLKVGPRRLLLWRVVTTFVCLWRYCHSLH